MIPGLAEATENLWHVVRTGHTAHWVDAGSDHVPDGDEHGCSGVFHLCSCHQSPPTTLTGANVGCDLAPPAHRLTDTRRSGRPDPESPGPFRPPRAWRSSVFRDSGPAAL